MLDEKAIEELEKEGYRIVGEHSAIKVCEWAKKSLRDKDFCFKEKFYGIKSHRCVQMSCTLFNCQNKCIHCWRNLKYTYPKKVNNPDSPKKIINGCVKEQQKILQGFKGSKKTNMKKFRESQEPRHFAISLIGEATLYPKLADFIKELRRQKKTSFLVTNGLLPEKLKELKEENALPTQLYVSLNYPNEILFKKITKNKEKNSWKKFNETLFLLPQLKTRTVIRLTLVKELNIENKMLKEYSVLIKKASPDFVEVKSYMAVGFARKRLGCERMPSHEEVKNYAKKLLKFLPEYQFLDEKKESRVVLLGKDKERMKIKDGEV